MNPNISSTATSTISAARLPPVDTSSQDRTRTTTNNGSSQSSSTTGSTSMASRPSGTPTSIKPITRTTGIANGRPINGLASSPGVPSPLNNSRLPSASSASSVSLAKPVPASKTRPIIPTSTTSTTGSTGKAGSNGRVLVSSSVPASRPPLSNVYRTTPILPTSRAVSGLGLTPGAAAVPVSSASRVSGPTGSATNSSSGHAPVLFDFRTTDRSPGLKRVNGSPNTGGGVASSFGKSPTPSSNMSLLSQRIRSDGNNGGHNTGKTTTVTNGFNVSSGNGNVAGQENGTPVISTAVNRRSSTTVMAASTGGGMKFNPRMRPRAMSVTMKIKGEVGPDGSDDEFDMDDPNAGEMAVDGDDGGAKVISGLGLGLGQGSGGIKGKRKGMVFKCESCAKVYRHPSCLSKHRWEHSPHWASSSKLLLSKHQQVQLLEAATILVHLDPHNPASGQPLPEDKSLWPAAVSPSSRHAKMPHRVSFSQAMNKASPGSPYSASSSLPAQPARDLRKPSPAGSTSSTESSDRSHSADHDSGYSSGSHANAALGASAVGRPIAQPVQSSPALGGSPLPPVHRPSFSAARPSSFGPGNVGSLPDLGFAGIHIGSPRSFSHTTPSGSQQNNMFHVGSAGTAKGHNIFSASPYSAHLRLPESSVRSNGFHGAIEEDEEDALDDDDEMNDHRDSYNARNKYPGASDPATRGMSVDREVGKTTQDVADMEWEANDMEL